MGYTTNFNGFFTFSRNLTYEEKHYINTFSNTRRVKRNVYKLQTQYNGKYGFNGNYGNEGEYFIGGEILNDSIIDYNTPPGQLDNRSRNMSFNDMWDENKKRISDGKCQPGLWCQWFTNGVKLEWNGSEKFYNYKEWLKYLIKHFFNIWNVQLNGEITYQGEKDNDNGNIVIINNELYFDMTIKDIRKMKLNILNTVI